MITFITDLRSDEIEILRPIFKLPLLIKTLSGAVLDTVDAPCCGWSHNALEQYAMANPTQTGDAFIGVTWVGSSEV